MGRVLRGGAAMEKVLWIGCAVTRDARGPRSGGVRNKVSRAWSDLQHAWSLGVRSMRFARLRYTESLMFPRVLAFLMAMVMLWSSVAVAEQRFAEALETPASTATVTVPGDAKRSDAQGSMDDHWVDDQPSQPFAEPAPDLAPWVDMHCAVPRCATRTPCPAWADEVPQAPPFLEGLRRPPRSV